MMLSIIVPVYNTPYDLVKRLMDSVAQQGEEDLEVIIVDDGSNSSYGAEIDNLGQDYNFPVQVHHQQNCGVSAARNAGVELSSGDYIIFADGDDILAPGFIKKAYSIAEKENVDVVFGKLGRFFEGDELPHDSAEHSYTVIGDKDIDKLKVSILGGISADLDYRLEGSPCGRLIKREVAVNIRFPEEVRYFEDQIYNRVLLNGISSAAVTNDIYYYYIQRRDSAMHSNYGNKSFYGKIKPYWNELARLNVSESGAVKERASINILNEYIIFIHMALIGAGVKITEGRKLLMEAAENPAIVNGLDYIEKKKPLLTKKEKLTYSLLRKKQYLILWLIVWCNRKMHGDRFY